MAPNSATSTSFSAKRRKNYYLKLPPRQRKELQKTFSQRNEKQPHHKSHQERLEERSRKIASKAFHTWQWVLGVVACCELMTYMLMPDFFLHTAVQPETPVEEGRRSHRILNRSRKVQAEIDNQDRPRWRMLDFFLHAPVVQEPETPAEDGWRSYLVPSCILERSHAGQAVEIYQERRSWRILNLFRHTPVVKEPETPAEDGWRSYLVPSYTLDRSHVVQAEIDGRRCRLNGSSLLMLAYILYFLDAFVRANEMWKKAVVAKEKKRLMRKDKEVKKKRYEIQVDPLFTFVSVLLFYLAILPVGFYLWWWECTIPLFTSLGEWGNKETNVISGADDHNFVKDAIFIPRYSHLSMGYAVLVRLCTNVSAEFRTALEERRTALMRRLTRRLAKFAIWNPRKFLSRFRKYRVAVRWVEYIVPINQHLLQSRLVSHVRDLIKKTRQRGDARYNFVCRRAVWLWLNDESRRDLAAIIIQRNYRSYQSRKWVRLVRAEEEKREEEIIKLVQGAMRRRLTERREALEEQQKALEELQQLQKEEKILERRLSSELNPTLGIIGGITRRFSFSSSGSFSVSSGWKSSVLNNEDDLKRKYEIQDEIKKRVKSEKERLMLLRPDSRFSFSFKVLYVICAIIEMSRLALKHRFEEAADETRLGFPGVEMFQFFVRYSDTAIGVVLCLGVFVSFFTGVIDPVTGRLQPKTFFSRWINQGMMLHLVVNPNMAEVSAVVEKIIKFVHDAGPGRVWRWSVMLLLPIWKYCVVLFEWRIWIRLVQKENQHRNLRHQRADSNAYHASHNKKKI